ncbi:cupin domain-containing protein [Puniceibacterium sediminis]|uniref:Cupin domain-containing protein n=1 Tax=Puniceibacterium sediminis TaxID=1608407 RepID=A0A238WY24_9RHOB|nr:Cupin domain-containing protein [Puniceibacterium sediminis]
MKMIPGVTKSGSGMDNISWNILGQTYVPKQHSESSMSWHATLPKGTFVPPHIHPHQDEFIYVLEGRFDLLLNGVETYAEPGDLIRLPMGIPHGIFNKTDTTIKCLFWVAPSRRLYDLFWALHNLGPKANPADVVAVSAQHEVDFLPPPEEA